MAYSYRYLIRAMREVAVRLEHRESSLANATSSLPAQWQGPYASACRL